MSSFDDKRATAIIQKAVEVHMYAQDAMPATEAARIMAAEELVQCAHQVEQIKDVFAAQGLTGDELIARVPTWPAIEEVLFTANVLVGSSNGDATKEEQPIEYPDADPSVPDEEQDNTVSASTCYIEWWAEPEKNAVYYRHVGCDTPHQHWIVPMDDCPLPDAAGETTEECTHCCYVVPLKKREEEPDVTTPQDSSASTDTTSVDQPQQEVSVEASDRPVGAAVTREDPKVDEPWLDAQGEEWLVLSYSGGQEARVRKVSSGEETVVPAGFLKTRKAVVLAEGEAEALAAEVDRESGGTFQVAGPVRASDPNPPKLIGGPMLPYRTSSDTPDDEGDDRYADLLDETSRRYAPSGMVVPHDLAYQPSPMPDGEHEINDAEAKRLHLQFNALAARAKFLHDVEDARARGCDLVRRLYLRGAKRLVREALGKSATETAVNEMAEDDENVRTWAERKQRHAEEASAWKTHFEINTQNVVVLSRDWTMRDRQVQS